MYPILTELDFDWVVFSALSKSPVVVNILTLSWKDVLISVSQQVKACCCSLFEALSNLIL